MNIDDLTMSIADTLCDAQECSGRTYQDLLNTAEVVVVLMRDHGSLKVSRDTVRSRIMAPLTDRRHGLRWWLQFAKNLVKVIGPQKPQRTFKQPQRDPAAVRAELIDSVAHDLNSAQVQSMVEGKKDKRRLDGVAAVASQSMGGDSFIPILRRLEGPLLSDEQWKEFLFRIPYR